MIRNASGQHVGVQMVAAADGSAFTGSVTVSVTGNAGTQATGSVGSGACTHEGNGYHTYAPAAAETNYAQVAFTFTGTGAVPQTVQVYPEDLHKYGITDQGTAQSATGTTLVLAAATPFAANDVNVGSIVAARGSTQGYWQPVIVLDYDTATDTVTHGGWPGGVTPSGTIEYRVFGSAAGADITTSIAAILADTNELQTDWANGGRLDTLLDGASSAGDPWTTSLPGAYGSGTAGKIIGDNINATISSRASQTSVDDIPTNAELATSQAAADDATLAAIAAIDARIPAALVSGRMDSSTGAMAADVITASALSAGAVDEILDDTIGDGTITMRQAMRVLIAGMAGIVSGAGTTTVTIRNTANTANVIVATVDASGNRSAVTVTP